MIRLRGLRGRYRSMGITRAEWNRQFRDYKTTILFNGTLANLNHWFDSTLGNRFFRHFDLCSIIEIDIDNGQVTVNEEPIFPTFYKGKAVFVEDPYNAPQRINIYGHNAVLEYSQFSYLFMGAGNYIRLGLYDCTFDKIEYYGNTLELHNVTVPKIKLGRNVHRFFVDSDSILSLLRTDFIVHHIPMETTILEDVGGVAHIRHLYEVMTKNQLRGKNIVTIADWVETIEASDFEDCRNLTSITIPNSVTEIGEAVFEDCNSLTHISVVEGNKKYNSRNNCNAIIETKTRTLISGCSTTIIPNSVTRIGSCAFKGCNSLSSITIPGSVTKIGSSAFEDCTSLTSITIPNSVTQIEGSAFEGCTSLTSITISDSVTKIESSVFEGCNSLTHISVAGGNKKYDSRNNCNAIIETKTNTLIRGCSTTIIPDGVTQIGDSAFKGCTSLSSITIPDGVTQIGDSTFENCTSLSSITIPNSVTVIGSSVFEDCTSLTSIIIPDSVTKIGWAIFAGCTSLTSITIPKSVTRIENFAFRGCTSLTSITILSGVTEIGSATFRNCTSLASITIPNSVTKIEGSAFEDCTSLTSITIPDSVIEIEESAFKGCSGLSQISVARGNKKYDSRNNCNAIIETKTNTLIRGCSTAFIPYGVTQIRDSAFEDCTSLTFVIIPDSVTEIGTSTFSNCTSLKSITIPDSVTEIGEDAFNGCTSLISIVIPDSVTEIGDSAFSNCTSLKSITIPDSVTKIGEYAFDGCTSLTSITIPDSVTKIGEYAFRGCTFLESIAIPSSVTGIGRFAFEDCENLKELICKSSTPPTICDDEFFPFDDTSGLPKNTTTVLKVPKGSIDAYCTAEGWHDFTHIEEI